MAGALAGVLMAGGAAVATAAPVPAATGAGCTVDYRLTSEWSGGFVADVTVTNLGSAVDGWTLSWTLPQGQQINNLWNGTVGSSTSGAVQVSNVDHNRSISAGGSVTFGFVGNASGSASVPSSFSLNGTTCNGTSTPAPTPTPTPPGPTPTPTP
ncbi:cellulose binding domain-containing protein, partial [Cellulomonas bogoriensis]|uniref:cellulose binding domain-containing protein n=1 Tax=Cellulomonas bogoriensis TaxID=301388 RepID=UPI000555FFD8